MCPLNLKEMNGSQPFVYLYPCGCVFSLSGLKAMSGAAPPGNADGQLDADIKGKEKDQSGDSNGKQLDMCPQCGAKYDREMDVFMLNPPSSRRGEDARCDGATASSGASKEREEAESQGRGYGGCGG